jgi:hypothetical protein
VYAMHSEEILCLRELFGKCERMTASCETCFGSVAMRSHHDELAKLRNGVCLSYI